MERAIGWAIKTCKAGIAQNEQGHCPRHVRPGSKQRRVSEEGQMVAAERQRIPWRLAAHVVTAMRREWGKADAKRKAQG